MRRGLILLAGAVTLMVALAFVVPLAFLVRDLAADRALSAGERRSQDVARIIATLTPERGFEVASRAIAADPQDGMATSLILPDGQVLGTEVPAAENIDAALGGIAFRTEVPGGQAIYTPVIQPDGSTVVVRVFVPQDEITAGVARSWLVLGGVGVVLVVLGVAAAEFLGRSIVRPVRDLAKTAERLGDGDLEARVSPAGPAEVHAVGVVFNRLAERVGRLIQLERDNAADMSHRLRTPLTALRLDVEGLTDVAGRQRVMDDLDSLERTVDFLIRQALRPVADEDVSTDLRTVVAERVAFWAPLAEERARTVEANIDVREAPVRMSRSDAEAIIDILFDNVFAHVPDATPMAVSLDAGNGVAVLAVEDGGGGFAGKSALPRGASSASSTGIGLDIVRKTVTEAGGSVAVESSPGLGGARVVLELPLI